MPLLSWPIYTMFDAYTARPPLEFVIHGIFSIPSVSIVYGAPGSLKSMLLADACMCVVQGKPWLDGIMGEPGISTKPHNVLWIDFDNGSRRSHERFDALGKAHGVPGNAGFFYASMGTPWLDMTKTGLVMSLIDTIEHYQTDFIVIDNLGVVSGDADENTTEMIAVMGNLRLLAERANCAVVVIHHQRKGNSVVVTRQGDALRGHSCIESAIDLALRVEREANSDTVTVKATKARGFDVPPFGALFSYNHQTGTVELSDARFWGIEIVNDTSDAAIDTVIMEVLAEEDEMNQKDLIAAVKDEMDKVGVNRVRGRLALLVKTGKVDERDSPGKSRAKLYSISAVQQALHFTPGP